MPRLVPVESQKFTEFFRIKSGSFYKMYRASTKEGLTLDFLRHILKCFKVMRLPPQFFNLASNLSVGQMSSLQLELNGVNLTNLRRIEEILGDYGLPVDTLSEKQIRGFANFVKSF